MFINVFRAQQAKTLQSRVLWVEVALLAGFAGLMTILVNSVGELAGDRPSSLAGQLTDILETTAASTMGGTLVLVLAGALMAEEYGWRSLHLWLGQGVSRPTFLWTKFASLLLPIALFFLVAAAVTAPLAAFFLGRKTATVGPITDQLGALLSTGALGAYGILPYAALAMLLAVAGRSMLVAVGGGLGLTLVVENLLVQLLAMLGGGAMQIVPYLPTVLSQSVLGADPEAAFTPLGSGPAAALIARYTIAFLGLATVLFLRQDLSD